MAHITVQLVWYRLGELYTNVGVKCERFLEWYEEFSWRRVDILDMLFLGWLVGAFVVVGAIHLYLRFFGLPRCKKSLTNGGPMSPGSPGMRGTVVEPHKTRAESVQWLNSAFSWLYQHYQHTPDFVDSWLRALNEEAKKHAVGEHQVRFDRIHVGSAPPRITHISTDLSASDVLSVYADIEAGSDTTLQISSIQQSATNIRVTACDATITQLKGKLNIQVKIQTDQAHEEIHTSIKFASTPSIKVAIKPRNYDTNIDQPMLESVVRAAICGAVTHVALSSRGGYPNFFATPAFKANGTAGGAIQPMSQVPRSLHGRRLLVKVIKANGLGDKDFGCADPYCLLFLDDPRQRHSTSVVRNTVNPFWDEHFQFELEDTSKQIKFEVFDREKPPGDDLLGRAFLAMDELRRIPSSRQIIPLTGRRGTTTTSGSITVEFLFMEPVHAPESMVSEDSISPKRRIETSRQVMPGGTLVTTMTTTTEKPRDLRRDPFIGENPNFVEKMEYSPLEAGMYQSYNRPSSQLGAHDAALTASQVGGAQPRLTVTGTEGGHMYGTGMEPSVPVIKMTESGPEDAEAKKSKSFASTLKKRFARPKKSRSQSADRVTSSSYRESALLKPPGTADNTRSKDDTSKVDIPEGRLRKSRSHSFSNSLKRIFKKKKNKDEDVSRENSVARTTGTYNTSRESSITHQSPDVTYTGRDLTLRHPTPNPEFPEGRYQYSMSVPNSSPLQDH